MYTKTNTILTTVGLQLNIGPDAVQTLPETQKFYPGFTYSRLIRAPMDSIIVHLYPPKYTQSRKLIKFNVYSGDLAVCRTYNIRIVSL